MTKDYLKYSATCEYISEHRNRFVTGATGDGGIIVTSQAKTA